VEAQRDAWIRDGAWEISGGVCEEEEGRAVVGGIVHQVQMCLVGEEWETDLCAEAGEFNPIAAGSSPRQRMISYLYAFLGGAPGFSVLMLLVAVASVAMYLLTVFSVYQDEGRQKFAIHPSFAFVLPSDTGKSLLVRVMEGAFCLHLDMPPPYPNGVGSAETVARRNITYKARSAVRTRVTTGTWEGVRDGLEGSVCGGENSKKPGTLIINAEGDSMVELLRVNLFGARLIRTEVWSRDGVLLRTASRHSHPVDKYGLCGTRLINNCFVETNRSMVVRRRCTQTMSRQFLSGGHRRMFCARDV
jgi:hypothetical protein